MNTIQQIRNYIDSQNEPKKSEIEQLHNEILKLLPDCKLWFHDGKNEENKVVANPNIGYGSYQIKYANGSSREWFRIGLSGNSTGISVYILGVDDKNFLREKFGSTLGKATVTGYCIKFKKLQDIDLKVLLDAIEFGYRNPS